MLHGPCYLGVVPARRKQGLGRQMMAAAEDWLRARYAAKIQG
ncbi:MAG: GNAT family N-acetyltransferase [Sphingomonadales bacterium]|nr:GNAT family N-acetyltransferase [Sphingomonadales bacterium]